MIPKNPQLSEGDKMERANNTLLGHGPRKGQAPTEKQKRAKEMFERNIAEHAVRTSSVKELIKEHKEDPDAVVEINAEAINRVRRGEPSKYYTDKDL